ELLGLSRTCVTKWRLYDPAFQAALNQRRAEVCAAGIDRPRSLIPKALDALADELGKKEGPDRLKAAGGILPPAQPPADALKTGPTDAEDIVRQVVEQRREQVRGQNDALDAYKGLPPFAQHMAATWRELEARAAEADEPAP